MTGNYGILDPNINEILEPLGIEKLIGSNPGFAMLPGLMKRRDGTINQVMEMIQANNKTRGGFAQQKLNNDAEAKEMEHAAALMGHAPNLVGKGVDLNQLTPYMPWLRKGNTLGANAQTQTNATEAYTENQLAEGVNRHVTAGFVPSLGKGPNAPRFYNPSNTPDNVGRGITANANDGKLKEIFSADGTKIGMERISRGDGMAPNLGAPGATIQDNAVAPQPEQMIRAINPKLKAAQISKLPQGKGFTATYKSEGKDVVVHIPADANGRPIVGQAKRVQ